MEPLQTWWATELYPSKDEDTFGVAGDFEVVRAADAQAAIAALQGRVKELEEWKRIVTGAGNDQESVIRLAAHEYTKTAVQCWKEANAKLETHLTQRTAELEAAKRLATNAQWQIDYVLDEAKKAFDLKGHYTPSDLVDCALRPAASMLKERDELKAELERVRALIKTYADAKIEFDDKRLQEDHHAWRERYNKLVEAENALLQHRQGMEG